MVTQQEHQAIVDEAHLNLLPIGYWVSAAFWGLYSLFMLGYFALIGTVFIAIPVEDSEPMPSEVVWIFLGALLLFLLVMAAIVTSKVLAGFWIRKREHRVATMVVAAIACLELPYGTLLGVATFIALARPSVKALYVRGMPYAPVSPAPQPPVGPGGGDLPPQPPVGDGGVAGTTDSW